MSDTLEFICDNQGCNEKYQKKTHEGCRLATNRRIMEKYYAKREQKSGKVRYCVKCQNTKLSRYNDSNTCSGCLSTRELNMNNSVVNMLLDGAWQ